MPSPRIAFFPDSFHEVNGVAHTARMFEQWARRHEVPFLCVRAALSGVPPNEGPQTGLQHTGDLWTLDLPRSRVAVRLEQDLWFDPLFPRHHRTIAAALRTFRPDVIHITGPSELGIAGAWWAWRLGVPLVASWHTNVHEYAARRASWLTARLGRTGERLAHRMEQGSLWAATRFYKLAKVLYAPNPPLCTLLAAQTGRPCHLMTRGVDTELFSPARRTRAAKAEPLNPVLGYVGRLSVEKNVGLLPQVDAGLRAQGVTPRWVIVGHGAEETALRRALPPSAVLTGVLRGQALADAYANMDLLLFPSHTDTFGNVVLEALASGTPAVVTPDGGPAHILQDGETGRIVRDEGFAGAVLDLLAEGERFATMREATRRYALGCSWDAVFEGVVRAYAGAGARMDA